MTRFLAICLVGIGMLGAIACGTCENYVTQGGELTKCRDGHVQVKFAPGQETYTLGDAVVLEVQKLSNHRSLDRIEVWVRVENRGSQEIRFDRYEVELDYQGRIITADEVGVKKASNLSIHPGRSTEQHWIFAVGLPPELGVYSMTLKNVRTHLNGDENAIGELVASVKLPGPPNMTMNQMDQPGVMKPGVLDESELSPKEVEPAEEDADDYWGVSGETGNATNPIDQ